MPKPGKEEPQGVNFPKNSKGERSTTAAGKAVWAAAAGSVDTELAAAITAERDWRYKYNVHVLRVAEAQAKSRDNALTVARAGLASLYGSFEFVRDGEAISLPAAMEKFTDATFETAEIRGTGAFPEGGAALPVPASAAADAPALDGDALREELARWVDAGHIEADAAATAGELPAERLDLTGRCFAVLGASSEVGPCRHLLTLGATVAAVGTRRPERWAALIAYARSTPGTLLVPVAAGTGAAADDSAVAAAAGLDIAAEAPELRTWLLSATAGKGPLTVGCYTYLDGEAHVRVNLACDAVAEAVAASRASSSGGGEGDATPVALHFLCSPATAHVVPTAAMKHAANAAAGAPWWQRAMNGLKFVPNARPPVPPAAGGGGEGLSVIDGLVTLQGPNYALAKTLQMWRAIVARDEGRAVASSMAPSVRTASMLHNATIATALNGMPHFKTCAYDACTASALMARLLIAQVRDPTSRHAAPDAARAAAGLPTLSNPTEVFAVDGWHGGLWRAPFTSESTATATYLMGVIAPRS